MKKLSKAQQWVIDKASERPCYIVNTPYEYMQVIVSIEPYDRPYDGDKTFKSHGMGHFYLTTFNVLFKRGLLTPTDKKNYYTLTPTP